LLKHNFIISNKLKIKYDLFIKNCKDNYSEIVSNQGKQYMSFKQYLKKEIEKIKNQDEIKYNQISIYIDRLMTEVKGKKSKILNKKIKIELKNFPAYTLEKTKDKKIKNNFGIL